MPPEKPAPPKNNVSADKRGEEHTLPSTNSDSLGEQESQQFALAKEKMDHEHRQQTGSRGTLGKIFGGGDEKAGNIAGLMAILCFATIAVLLLAAFFLDIWENVDAIISVLGAILTACLGYLFGRK